MNNIILIGMSGAGKSTLGVLLAKAVNKSFVDTDLLIQNETKMLLWEYIEKNGIQAFKEVEEKILLSLKLDNCVIATGGSVVYSDKGMEHLKSMGEIIYLDVEFSRIEKRLNNIKTRGIVMEKGQSFSDIYEERVDLYKKYADHIITIKDDTVEETVSKLVGLKERKR